jgi:hypothetical protein
MLERQYPSKQVVDVDLVGGLSTDFHGQANAQRMAGPREWKSAARNGSVGTVIG